MRQGSVRHTIPCLTLKAAIAPHPDHHFATDRLRFTHSIVMGTYTFRHWLPRDRRAFVRVPATSAQVSRPNNTHS